MKKYGKSLLIKISYWMGLKHCCKRRNCSSWLISPFATMFLKVVMHLQQMTFERIVTKEEIAHNEQFLNLQLCFQFFWIILLSFIDIFFIKMFSKAFAVQIWFMWESQDTQTILEISRYIDNSRNLEIHRQF